MSKKSHKRAMRTLEARIKAYDAVRDLRQKTAMKRPGSTNRKKH